MAGRVTVVIGGQFGSEAKGKVIAFLANEIDVAVRTGAPNAGHTVISKEGIVYKLQQIPATFLNPSCRLYIGAGALIDPAILARESALPSVSKRLFIDPQAGIISPVHGAQEKELKKSIGSTGKGCGAALAQRIKRVGFELAGEILHDYQIASIAPLLNTAVDEGKHILVEGTQGFGLSLYHGIYPFVTSRDTTAANFLAEAGLSPRLVTDIILVIRTYPIRVAGNSGPLPYECSWEDLSKKIGTEVREFSTVTNRVRRVADFDINLVQKALQANRPTHIALQFLNYLFPQDEGKSSWNTLSTECRGYVSELEKRLGVPITLLGTGAAPGAMIDRRDHFCDIPSKRVEEVF